MNNLIRRIEENTRKRKKLKDRIDSEIALSVSVGDGDAEIMSVAATGADSNRLLDEGAVIEGDGSVYAYIKKGTLEKFLNRENVYLDNLPEDFVGNINIGHLDHATFPFPVGDWTMDNMRLVDIGDGRSGLDVDITVDEESVFIKEIQRLGYDVSMSAEFYTHTDYQATEDLGMWVIDEILIFAYAIVGDGKNVNSNGMKLNVEADMDKEKVNLESTMEDIPVEEPTEDEVELTADKETAEETEEVNAEAEEEAKDTDEEEFDAEEADGEEAESEEADPEEDGEEADGEDEAYSAVEAHIKDLESKVEELNAKVSELADANAELKKTNKRLNKKLKAEYEKKDAFASKFTGMVEATGEKKPEEQNKVADYVFGDGIGE